MRVAITGGSGFLGRLIRRSLSEEGHEVLRLVRYAPARAGEVYWDYSQKEVEKEKLQKVDLFIHLSGENISRGRWTESRKQRLYSSRVESTRFLSEVIRDLDPPPRGFFTASAVGIYGDRGDETLTEASPPGEGFLARLARDWESATEPARERGIRVVPLRFGMVLSKEGGALPLLMKVYRFCLGGRLGSGNQWVSWVAEGDVIGILRFLLERTEISGAVNVVSPQPVRQREFSALLARALRRPAFCHAPAFLLRWFLGEMAREVLLASQRAYPQRLSEAGYVFQEPDLGRLLAKLTGS
jgi:uncharacterized protein (TIGR01777 family)